jgi:hypothetical protein
MFISALSFQVKGDKDFTVFLEKQMQSKDTDPGYKEILRFICQVKYYC